MSYVTILWAGAAAIALLLGLVHLTVWLLDRRAWVNLAFAVVALSLTGIAITELSMMMAVSAEQWGRSVWWCHFPLFLHIAGTVIFVRLYFGAGRNWLMWTTLGLRGVILLGNALTHPNFNFLSIRSIGQLQFLGEPISVVTDAVTSPWQVLATASTVLFALFILDATIELWRRGSADDRRKAIIVGGGILFFAVFSAVCTQLVLWRLVHLPMLITPTFMLAAGVMAIELGRDTLRAGRLARELRESEGRLELAAEAGELGLWTWDSQRGRVWATERARELFGFTSDAVIDLGQLGARVHPEDLPRVRSALSDSIDRGAHYSVQFRVCTPSGTLRWIASQGEVESGESGQVSMVRGVLRDVTDQQRARDEAEELRSELTHASRVSTLGQLSSALAHELSQPLGAILRNAEAAEMLLAAPSPDLKELREIIADIQKDDRRAADVIDRLRALLKRRELQLQPVAIDTLVRDASTLVRADAATRHVVLECRTEGALPMVAGDRVHLSQVLINLILNGMDAVVDSVDPRRSVTVVARTVADTAVEIAVTDSGPGIPAATMPRIFEPFFTTKASGMGMGLSVSRTIVEAHGGKLWAENGSAAGAIFRFTLPVIPEASA